MFRAQLDPDRWAQAAQNLFPNNNLDPQMFGRREALVQTQAKEQKLERAIQEGRMYGLARDHYSEIRSQRLEARLRKDALTDAAY